MNLSRERQGELFVLGEKVMWALFPVVTILSYGSLSPLVSFTGSTFFAAVFFAAVLTFQNKWPEVFNVSALKYVLLGTLFIGVIYYLLSFFGLRYTSAGNAAIIALTEVLFSYMFFQVWRKDYLPTTHKIGAVFMLIGAGIMLYPNIAGIRGGEILILAAAAIAPIGNLFQQKARKIISSESIMFTRSFITSAVGFSLIVLFKENTSLPNLTSSIFLLILNGVFLLGLAKIFWIEGIHRISVTKANALSTVSPLLTLIFAWILLHNNPTIWQLFSLVPMCIGLILLSRSNTRIA